MKLAYIILAHKNPQQVVRLVNALGGAAAAPPQQESVFFVHLDKKADSAIYRHLVESFEARANVHLIERYDSAYASFGLVEATMAGLNRAIESETQFDYLINLSGQDYPIKTNAQIRQKLGERPDFSYLWYLELPFVGTHPTRGIVCQKLNRIEYWHVRRNGELYRFPLSRHKYREFFSVKKSFLWLAVNLFLPRKRPFIKNYTAYGGGQWWCLSRKHAEYIYQYVKENKKQYDYFKHTNFSDEIFFQTLLLNSPHKKEIINDDLRLLYFTGDGSHPLVYNSGNYPVIADSSQLFARKFDAAEDESILDLIDENLLSEADVPALSLTTA